MKELLIRLADKVQLAVTGFKGDHGKKVKNGAYGVPTSAIDLVAERAIIDELESSKVDINVLSEEVGFIDNGSDLTLVVDPIDGTHNLERGLPIYSTSLAIGRKSMEDTMYGVVRNLVSGATYYASKGNGAYLGKNRLRVRRYDPEDTLFTVYLSKNAHRNAHAVASRARRVRNLGAASLDMCLVACGAADVYYMNSTAKLAELRVVDIAASALILREAGGEVVDLGMERLDMPFDAKMRSNLIAYGDPKVLELVR